MAQLPPTADAVVVGGGVMGAAIAFHLAARGGGSVVLLERAAVCSGPTRHSTAIVRLHYTQPLLVRMALHGLRTYRRFEDAVGSSSGFARTGMLFGVAPEERAMLEQNVAVGRSEGAETFVVDAEQVAELDPRIVADDLAFCFEPEAGRCDPYLVTAGFAAAARRAGASVAEGVRATAVSADGTVDTTAGRIAAGAVVVAAGVWSRPLLAPLGYDLPVHAAPAEVGRYRLPDGFTPPPAVADFSGPQLYFCPVEPGFLEVGSLAPAHADETVDPDVPPEGARADTLDAYARALRLRLRGSNGGHWRGAWTGVYDVTPDWEPTIGRVPGCDGVHVAAGFSGHGFKLAPAVGTALAELVLDGASRTFDLDLLAPDRFERGALVGARYGYSVLG
ncbi:MAG TPA: FAD-binding oxidoreductase [Gaiellaceae bacterium]|nr:FAD-binding oxidoreductase [Gaiellaceae bacterium]